MATHEIKNFHEIDATLGTGGQPTSLQLRELAQDGYEVVVNLGLLDPRYCLPDEAGVVTQLGMKYHHIPVMFDDPRGEDFNAFVAVMDANAAARVFVHCALNWRVSSFVALYRQMRTGWSVDQADAHARRFWNLNETWLKFVMERRKDLGLGG
jgi:protein tyrosine phosphatase (PTP) superfamily phosphohydrolase (DUF442 family)